jgi:hypothetical protein
LNDSFESVIDSEEHGQDGQERGRRLLLQGVKGGEWEWIGMALLTGGVLNVWIHFVPSNVF